MKLQLTILTTLLLLAACGSDDPTGPVVPGTQDPVDPTVVNNFVQSLPDWEVPDDTELAPELIEDSEDFDGQSYVRCETTEYDRKKNFDNLVAVGANATALKPGMLVQGSGVRDGALSVIGLKRSPIAISVDLALETPSRRIDVPSSATIQDAVASIQREADTRLGELDVIPAQISFQATSVYSFDQAMMDAGISVSYSAVFASGSVGSSISQSTTTQRRVAMVKLFQPMYTISFADDELAEPASFFSEDVTDADFERQRQLGTMGPNNQPCYVQSVTYGRMLVYTASSSEAESASELQAALQASYGFWSGSAEYSERQRSLVQNSSYEIQVFGGTQADATEAIRHALATNDYSLFIRPVPATTAVPLSYRINDMKNRRAAVIGDATKYSIQTCEAFNDLRFRITLDRIELINGCDAEETFDIETGVTADSDWYWLLHNSGSRFDRDDLANGGETAIFEFSASQGSTLEFYVADFGNGSTGREGWSTTKTFDFPFQFDNNPHTFSIVETTTDDSFRNCTMEVFYTIERELINLP